MGETKLKMPSPRQKTERAKTPSLFARLKHLESQVRTCTHSPHIKPRVLVLMAFPQAATARKDAVGAKQANTALKEELNAAQLALQTVS